ncbi:LamG domain-containing protein [Actinacidiphila glaucinigra]|uniref:LamG domain-containing protein n=1 Tax=Actinacidiphila glaucinigra TaxID=235986 RepID=UPI0033A81A87
MLRIDGTPLAAERLRWSPWGVERAAAFGTLAVHTEVRMGYERSRLLWRITLRNISADPVRARVEQELLAMFAHHETDWGWLYGTPWNHGHHHDFHATERLRSEVLADRPRQVQTLPHGERWLRLGSPRVPGIQRDEDAAPMLLESELPDHSSPDAGRVREPGAPCLVDRLEVRRPDGTVTAVGGEGAAWTVRPGTDLRVGTAALGAGDVLALRLRVDQGAAHGVVITHGNHPDSATIGLDGGRLFLRIGGEQVVTTAPLSTGRWHRVELRFGDDGARLDVDGTERARTRPWWEGRRWTAGVEDGALCVADSRSPARSPDLAAGILRRAHRTTSGALWGQAMEVTADGTYRVAERGVSNRESVAAVAVTEAVLAGLFGVAAEVLRPGCAALENGFGRLTGVRVAGRDLTGPGP